MQSYKSSNPTHFCAVEFGFLMKCLQGQVKYLDIRFLKVFVKYFPMPGGHWCFSAVTAGSVAVVPALGTEHIPVRAEHCRKTCSALSTALAAVHVLCQILSAAPLEGLGINKYIIWFVCANVYSYIHYSIYTYIVVSMYIHSGFLLLSTGSSLRYTLGRKTVVSGKL